MRENRGLSESAIADYLAAHYGGADHIVPFAHGAHCVERLPNATLHVMEGESHLGGLGLAEEILRGLTG